MAVALSCWLDDSDGVLCIWNGRVLDVDVVDVVLNDRPCLIKRLESGLHVVSCVVDCAVVRGVDAGDQILHALRGVAVDSLFIFVEEGDAAGLCEFDHCVGAGEYFFAEVFGVVAFCNKEGEHADVFRAEELSDLNTVACALQVIFKRIGDVDLA